LFFWVLGGRESKWVPMNQSLSGPPGNGDRLREAVGDLHAVRRFLEVPYRLTPRDWQEAYDGLRQVVIAAGELATILTTRCTDVDRATDLRVLDDLLRDVTGLLSRTGSGTETGDSMRGRH
jgi:hypothetical protein